MGSEMCIRDSSDAVLHVQFSPDGKKVASGGGDATVRLWDALANIPQKTYSGHKHHVLCLSWSPDARMVASGDRAGEVRVWRSDGECRVLKRHSKWITALAWLPCHLADASQTHCELLASAFQGLHRESVERQDRANGHVVKRPF